MLLIGDASLEFFEFSSSFYFSVIPVVISADKLWDGFSPALTAVSAGIGSDTC